MGNEELTIFIDEEIKKIEEDERYHYPLATIFENAPLAMVQLELGTKMTLLKKFKQKNEMTPFKGMTVERLFEENQNQLAIITEAAGNIEIISDLLADKTIK